MGADIVSEESKAQQYEGDDVSALVTAKQRMAERDAEYAAKFKQFAEGKKPATPRRKAKAAPAAKQDYSNEGRSVPVAKTTSVDSPNEVSPVPAKAEAPSDPAPVAATKEDEGIADVSYADVNRGSGLRGLKGTTDVPKSDREEFSVAWHQK